MWKISRSSSDPPPLTVIASRTQLISVPTSLMSRLKSIKRLSTPMRSDALASSLKRRNPHAAWSAVSAPACAKSIRWKTSAFACNCSMSMPNSRNCRTTRGRLTKWLNLGPDNVSSGPWRPNLANSAANIFDSCFASRASASKCSSRSLGTGFFKMSTMIPVRMFNIPREARKMYTNHTTLHPHPMVARGAAKGLQSAPVIARNNVVNVRDTEP
mmetsp:Transcript_97848/g.273963  ORF Transcript_97848/g.273963 Transcript_97848/m.273963 type:complete len:214 (-) Transcript_97848:1273-1914(-)